MIHSWPPTPIPRPLIALALIFVTLPFEASSQTEVLKETYQKAKDTQVEVNSIFGPMARQGTVPFRVRIRNNSGKDRIWTVTLEEGNSRGRLSTSTTEYVEVENGSEVIREITMPVSPSFTAYSYRYLNTKISSPGLPSKSRSNGYQTNDHYATLAISKTLARRSLSDLDEFMQNRGTSDTRFAFSYDPEHLPSSWEGYSSLDALLVDHESWNAASTAQRRATLEWVRLGGRLDVFARTSPNKVTLKDLKIPGIQPIKKSQVSGRLSLGQIHVREWDGDHLSSAVVESFDRTANRGEELENQFGRDWPLKSEFGTKEFNPALILFPLLIFAIIVAPVNLFYFAKRGRRHRLFLTTPIISVSACLIIITIIFFEDGVGGNGIRNTLADIQSHPNEMRIYLSQEQISRTGVMVNPGFKSDTQFTIDPISLPDSVFNPLSQSSNRNSNYRFIGPEFRGDFFRSRSEQGFSIRSAIPTRARIEIKASGTAGSPPTLTSSLPTSILDLYFRDNSGKVWKSVEGPATASGSSIQLEESDKESFNKWINQQSHRFSKAQRNRIKNLAAEPGRYFTLPVESDPYTVNTHPKISWDKEFILLTGRVVNQNNNSESDE
tara:strand:+ start:1004 stop:2827 length:1824 start_codon:yes stop_codon:yes gene_type:complete